MAVRNPKTDGNEDLLDNDDVDRPDDEVAFRIIELDGKTFEVRATDPYGLWHIIWHKGRVPDDLAGEYTSATDAENALKAYLAAKNFKNNASSQTSPGKQLL